jgi:two-component system response regulator NreC
MTKIKVLIADDHTIVRKGLRKILTDDPAVEVVGEASNGREAVRLATQLKPAVVIMDVAMPELNGIEATRQITQKLLNTKVLVLTMHEDESYVRQMIKAGAKAYLLKDTIESELIQAIKTVHQGDTYLNPRVSKIIVEDYHQRKARRDRYELLTAREREILQLVATGKSSKQIAEQLYLSAYTVDTHRKRIMEKLDLHTTAELTACAIRKGLI